MAPTLRPCTDTYDASCVIRMPAKRLSLRCVVSEEPAIAISPFATCDDVFDSSIGMCVRYTSLCQRPSEDTLLLFTYGFDVGDTPGNAAK